MGVLVWIGWIFLAFSPRADATLIVRGYGTSTYGTYKLIYDTDLNITWYDYTHIDVSHFYWQDYMNWAAGLSVTFNGTTYSDWRLPITVQPDPSCSWTDSNGQSYGWGCKASEMGHLYYLELGNMMYGPPNTTGPFDNLWANVYWSGTEYAPDNTKAWMFDFFSGSQGPHDKNIWANPIVPYAIAVRDGDVLTASVPEPATFILLSFGLAGMVVVRKRIKIV